MDQVQRNNNTELLEQFRWEYFAHPPYSPHLAPSDFLLCGPQTKYEEENHLWRGDDVKTEVR
jgi:hypothetical protein